MTIDDPLHALIARYDLRDGRDLERTFGTSRSDLPRGWVPLATELVEALILQGWDRGVLQVKEKFGTLRFYISQRDSALAELTLLARERSATICQECGEPGSLFERGRWWSTMCESCRGAVPPSST